MSILRALLLGGLMALIGPALPAEAGWYTKRVPPPCPLAMAAVGPQLRAEYPTGVSVTLDRGGVHVYQEGVEASNFRRSDRTLTQITLEWPEPWKHPDDLVGKDVADIGCGGGSILRSWRNLGVHATGVEIILDAKQREEAAQDPTLFLEREGRHTGLPDNSFDYVYCSYSVFTFEMSPQTRLETLKELVRIVRPGGKIRVGPIVDSFPEEALAGLNVRRTPLSPRTFIELEKLP